MAGGSKLNRREQAIAALLAEPTVERAAARAGISAATLKRWLAQPDFAGAFRQARRELVENAITRLQQTTLTAVATLHDCMQDDKPAQARVRAAAIVVEQSLRASELVDLQQQVDELKAAVKEIRREQEPTGPRPYRTPGSTG
jgi:hypothetical protein